MRYDRFFLINKLNYGLGFFAFDAETAMDWSV